MAVSRTSRRMTIASTMRPRLVKFRLSLLFGLRLSSPFEEWYMIPAFDTLIVREGSDHRVGHMETLRSSDLHLGRDFPGQLPDRIAGLADVVAHRPVGVHVDLRPRDRFCSGCVFMNEWNCEVRAASTGALVTVDLKNESALYGMERADAGGGVGSGIGVVEPELGRAAHQLLAPFLLTALTWKTGLPEAARDVSRVGLFFVRATSRRTLEPETPLTLVT